MQRAFPGRAGGAASPGGGPGELGAAVDGGEVAAEPRERRGHGERLPGEASPEGCTVQLRAGGKAGKPSCLMHLGMLSTGATHLVSVPVQHKFPALTRLLLRAKLEKSCDSKGRKMHGKAIYIGNYVLLVLLQGKSHLNFSWPLMEK